MTAAVGRPRAGAGGAPDPREVLPPLLPGLRAYARLLVGGDDQAADDLVQDTVVLALRAWDSFTPGTNLKAWLFRILHNRHLSLRGRRHRTAEVGVDDLEPLAAVPAFQEGRAELRHFKAAFARLPASQREPLVLWAVHGLPYERIAEACGCEVGSIKSRMSRARTTLKALVLGDKPIGDRTATPLPARSAPRAKPVPVTPSGTAPVALAAAVPALVPPPPGPILVRPFPVPPAWRLPWLADVERRIAQTELQVARHRRVVERLGAVGLTVAGVEAVARLAEERLGLLQAHHRRLLDGADALSRR